MHSFDAPISIRHVSEKNLSEPMASLRGYLKFASLLWIRAARQPTLDGVIIGRWSKEAQTALNDFCGRKKYSEVLLRTDALNQRWSIRRGGYLIPQARARSVVREVGKEHRICAFLEPLSPHRDLYSLAGITDEDQTNITVEVVGPGFDASDLLRSDMSPHERFEVPLSKDDDDCDTGVSFRRIFRMETDEYLQTVDARLIKIGARLRNPAYPSPLSEISNGRRAYFKDQAITFLGRTRQTLLLRHLHEYQPIPPNFLRRFVSGVNVITGHLNRHNCFLGATGFSGTFTSRGRLVFWDFFPADRAKAELLYIRA